MSPFQSCDEEREAKLERERQAHYEYAAAYAHEDIDEALAVPDPPQRRSDQETTQLLAILDELGRGKP